jgi:surface protein
LYLSIAAQELKHWKSTDTTKAYQAEGRGQDLAPTQREVIDEYMQNLTKLYHHDQELVHRVTSYLHLTDGLSESELLEILSIDEDFIDHIAPDTYHNKTEKTLPVVIWARLHSQLKPFLKLENKDGQETMSFFHREFNAFISEDIDTNEQLVHILAKLLNKHKEEGGSNRYGELWFTCMKLYIRKLVDIDPNKNLNHFDVSNVTDMSGMFKASRFNGDISKWDVSKVMNMNGIFEESGFNGDISKWVVSNVTDMRNMFYFVLQEIFDESEYQDIFGKSANLDTFKFSRFNGDISKWDVSNVTDMANMFAGSQFNGDISKWVVSNVTDMTEMFCYSKFNGDISDWNVSNVEIDMPSDFEILDSIPDMLGWGESEFSGDTSKWTIKFVLDNDNIKEVVNQEIKRLGDNANLNHLDVSEVTVMKDLFGASNFNGDISLWDVSNVENMSGMFYGSKFNGSISDWITENVKDMTGMFIDSDFNNDISQWDVSSVVLMGDLFRFTEFDGDISQWTVSNVTDMVGMFADSKFNGDISNWDVSSVTDLDFIFEDCPIPKEHKPKFKE